MMETLNLAFEAGPDVSLDEMRPLLEEALRYAAASWDIDTLTYKGPLKGVMTWDGIRPEDSHHYQIQAERL